MKDDVRKALSVLKFDVLPAMDDVWRDSPFHVEGLHGEVLAWFREGIETADRNRTKSPAGIVLSGQAGSGKTHLLGWVRRTVQERDGYFFIVDLLDAAAFWPSVTLAITKGLASEYLGKSSQLEVLLTRLCEKTQMPADVSDAVVGRLPLSRESLDTFVNEVRKLDRNLATAHHTLRALVLLSAESPAVQDVGYNYLLSMDEMEPGERHEWGIQAEQKMPKLIVREVTHLVSLVGPAVIAIDQVDTLVAQAAATDQARQGTEDERQLLAVSQFADGLMALRESTRATLTVLACLPSTWEVVKTRSTKSVADRFDEVVNLDWIPTAEIGRQLIARRFTVQFEDIGFKPPYSTWPIRPEAFKDSVLLTPRRLIKNVMAHVRQCLQDGTVIEAATLNEEFDGEQTQVSKRTGKIDLASLDRRYHELRSTADISGALDTSTEDKAMSALLGAGLSAWVLEHAAAESFTVDPPQAGKAPLHARLRHKLNDATDDEQHWSFRAVSHEHPIAALARMRAAWTAAGLSKGFTKRKLFFLRNSPWNKGAKTQLMLKEVTDAGGLTVKITEDDLRTFAALAQMLADGHEDLQAWLRRERPAGQTALLRAVLADMSTKPTSAQEITDKDVDVEPETPSVPTVLLGSGMDDGQPLHVDLRSLRKHMAIFAGSGSGKTVLIRRLIEECALQGVSTIVLDPNNDLARLGDAWPLPPDGWKSEDAARARTYLAETDVVVWTPRRAAGRALTFQPLPDFRGVLNDGDEFGTAIDAAVASLAPRARVQASTAKAGRGQAVLNEALRYFARRGGQRVDQLIDILSELPDGVSRLDDADRIAFEVSQNLKAAMVTDPMFGGDGAIADPGELLTPSPGKRARVSVVNFVGLPSEDQRQSFVNQLQMALFAWIKENPAGDRPLGGLLVMDEAQTFAPSGALTACTQSTLALASQARKYGLGLVFATQAPKSLHNRIPGNASTQFFGRLNAPVQIEAAREMARAKGAEVPDISRLGAGEFYASGESFAFQKVATPMCLSYHGNPLTTEEVIERAARSR